MHVRVLLLALVLMLPTAVAMPVHEDAAGDVEVRLAEQEALEDPTGRFDPVDLRALSVDETALDIIFRLDVAALPSDGVTFLDDSVIWIVFEHGEEQYGLRIRRAFDETGVVQHQVNLHEINPDTDLAGHATLVEHEVDPAGTVAVTVPRKLIPDGAGAPPRPGTALTGLEVLSFGFGTLYIDPSDTVHRRDTVAVIRTLDRMPDDGPGGEVPFSIGVRQEGDLELRSSAPVRVSNGGAGLFIFEVEAANHGDEPMPVDLAVTGVPEGWDVRLPFDEALMRPGEPRTFPVMAAVESGHQHGGLEQFVLEMAGAEGHAGRVQLGIQYTVVPQPAGHHDTVWFHARENPPFVLRPLFEVASDQDVSHSLYMNTLQDDPADAQEPVEGGGISIPTGDDEFGWRIPLSPALAMGLHLDPSETGEITVPVEYDYVGEGLEVSGELRVVGEETAVVARVLPAGAQDITAGSAELQGTVEPVDGIERIPFEEGQQLELVLRVTGTFNGPTAFTPNYQPRIAPGGWMRMPLLEYQDAPEAFTDAYAGLEVGLPQSHRDANAGGVLLAPVTLENHEDAPLDVALSIDGIHADWARLESARITVPADGSATARVRIDVPDDAVPGEQADLVITAQDPDDPFLRAVGRLTVAVVEEPVADDAEALDGWAERDKESPLPFLAPVALAAVLAMRRRRH